MRTRSPLAPVALSAALLSVSIAAFGAGRPAGADTMYGILVGGRPTDASGSSARLHDGHIYVNLVRITRALAGLLTFHNADHSELVTVGGRSVAFTVGSRTAILDNNDVTLPGAPFESDGDIFVPLEIFASMTGGSFTVSEGAKVVRFDIPSGTLIAPPLPTAAPVPAPT